MKFCSVTGCGTSITDKQAETTERLFGKAFCLEHEKGGPGETKKETPAPGGKNEEEPKKAEAGKDKAIKEPETGSEKPEVTVPGNVIAVLDKHGWAINNNIATKAIASHGVLIDLTKTEQRGKAAYVDTYPYQHGQNNIIDAELKSLFGEITKVQDPKEKNKMEIVYDTTRKEERSPPKVLENAVARIESLELNTETVLRYLCPDASVEEALMFLQVCKIKNLNPFSPGEVFLIKYDKTQPASIVVGKYAFTKKADQHPDYRGYQAGIIVLTTDGKIEEREGTFYLPKGKNAKEGDVFEMLLGGWVRVLRANRQDIVVKVALQECIRYKKDGQPNRSWAEQPATMVYKSAVVRGLRDAFPAELGGLYDQSEVQEVD